MGNAVTDSTVVMKNDTAQVNRANTTQVKRTKNYSDDKNIWEGMTVKEAYSKGEAILKIFNSADKDGNGVIDKNELQRYNGPVYRLEKKVDGDSISLNFKGHTSGVAVTVGNGGVGVGPVSGTTEGTGEGKIIKTLTQDFYPGLEVDKVEPWAREKFQDFDVAPKDGILSKKEMKIYRLNEKIRDSENNIKEVKNSGAEIGGRLWQMGGFVSGIVTIAGLLEKSTPFNPISKTARVVGGIVGGMITIGMIAGGGHLASSSKNEINKEKDTLKALEEEKNKLIKSK